MLIAPIMIASLLCATEGAAHADPLAAAATEANVLPFITKQLTYYATEFRGGEWTSTETPSWAPDDGGPTSAAATLYVLTGNKVALGEAQDAINTAIATRQHPNGGFMGPGDGQSGEGIATMFFGLEFGTTYRLLAPYLNRATRARWRRSLEAAANYLISSGDTTWYVNGNINLGFTEFLWLVWQATDEAQYKTAYNASWRFTLDPPQAKFPGSGWVTVRQPARADGAGGRGYFTEMGPGGNGYDPDYTQTQLDTASRLYLLSGDPRALRVTNTLLNMIWPRINKTTWKLNTSDGTRHTERNRYDGLWTSSLAVLGLDAGRSGLVKYILPQLKAEETWYPQPGQANSPLFRRAFGDSVAVIALAAAEADPALSAAVKSDLPATRARARI